jgi:hypothetical protein
MKTRMIQLIQKKANIKRTDCLEKMNAIQLIHLLDKLNNLFP